MPSYTLDQLNTITQAIAEGATRVKYQDKEVEYRSLQEMREIKAEMEADLGLTDNIPTKVTLRYGSEI